jgi:hypothetical protein
MSADSLDAHGLLWNDSYATDHILVCADYRPTFPVGFDLVDSPVSRNVYRLQVDPNPTRGRSTITLHLPHEGAILLEVYDEQGRCVAAPFGTSGAVLSAGAHSYLWDGRAADGRNLPAGIYFISVRGRGALGDFHRSGKWTLLR